VPTRSLSPEARLVFRSADPSCDPRELWTHADQVTDWMRALILAEQEGATPTLWRALQKKQPPIPEPAVEFLHQRTMLSDFRMQLLSQRLQETLKVFAARGIPLILLKGAAVGALTDPTFRARPMSDLDLLVKREDVERAKAAIIDAGWTFTTDPRLLDLLQDQHHLPPFFSPLLPGLRLELHVELLAVGNSFTLTHDAIWRDSQPAPAPFEGARLLSLEHMLLHVCAHFAWQHSMRFAAWRTVRTIAAIAAQPALSWERLEREARNAKALTSCYWTLRIAERLSSLRVPPEVMTKLAPPTPEWLRRMLERHFIAELAMGESPTSPSVALTRLLWRAALRPKWSGHGASERNDSDHRWERAFGTYTEERIWTRVARHAASYRTWWAFFTNTLLG